VESRPRILVIDDERGIREGCRRVLQSEGFLVETAEDGESGLRAVESGEFDLLLLDVKMPGMSGIQLVRQVRELDPTLVCVMITGYATLETAVEATRSGAYDFLPKPFTPDELLAKVGKGLDRRWLELEARRLRQERERSLLEISAEKSRLLTVINCIRDAVLVTNRDGQLVLCNPAALSLLRSGEGAPVGRPVEECAAVPELGALVAGILLHPDAGTMQTREIPGPADGQVLMANAALVRDETSQVIGSVTVARDVTALRQLDRAKSQFIAMVAHELTAPLAAIRGYMDILLSDAPGEEETRRQMIERSRERASALLDLIDDLLDVASIEAGQVARTMERLEMPGLLAEAVEMAGGQATAARVNVTLGPLQQLPAVHGNREDLLRVIGNLLGNAIKYNRNGGSVYVSARPQGGMVRLQVRDTGIGIPAECLPRVFDEFYRVKRAETRHIAGTGLGLSIVKKIVDAHHGRVEVESVPGEGSTFSVFLPVA
jgi:two-component system, OmpR family, phosphate regulon sensor histidine kinase PhoR